MFKGGRFVLRSLSRLLLGFLNGPKRNETASTKLPAATDPRTGTEGHAGRVGHGGLFTSGERA
jgi:hypothetical protein